MSDYEPICDFEKPTNNNEEYYETNLKFIGGEPIALRKGDYFVEHIDFAKPRKESKWKKRLRQLKIHLKL